MSQFNQSCHSVTVEAVEVIELDEPVWVYDIEVPDDKSFQASGIVLHNSKLCASRDGQRYKVGSNHPTPPAHPNCRSVLSPSFDDDIMGQRPYVRAFKPISQIPKDQRPDDMVGQVSAKTNYAQWFGRQPASFQKEWLGPARYDLYKKGGYKLDRFVDPQGKQYTLAELREKDAQTFRELFGDGA